MSGQSSAQVSPTSTAAESETSTIRPESARESRQEARQPREPGSRSNSDHESRPSNFQPPSRPSKSAESSKSNQSSKSDQPSKSNQSNQSSKPDQSSKSQPSKYVEPSDQPSQSVQSQPSKSDQPSQPSQSQPSKSAEPSQSQPSKSDQPSQPVQSQPVQSQPGQSQPSQSQQSQQSQSQLVQPANPQSQNQQVTVETETVPSVPTLGVINSSATPNSMSKVKRSQDSVPRSPSAKGSMKKRSQRMAQGSKADFFAAKVADAVDEQDSSGSDETFVYDTTQNAPPSTYADSSRRPYIRSTSDVSFTQSPPNAGLYTGYFGDDSVYDSESDVARTEEPEFATTNTQSALNAQSAAASHNAPSYNAPSQNVGPAGHGPNSHNHGNGDADGDANPPFRVQRKRNLLAPKRTVYSAHQDAGALNVNTGYANAYHQDASSHSAAAPYGRSRSVTGGAMPEYAADESHWYAPPYAPPSHHPKSPSRQAAGHNAYAGPNARTGRGTAANGSARADVSPHRDSHDAMRAKHAYSQRWRVPVQGAASHFEDAAHGGAAGAGADDDERASSSRGRPSSYNYHSSSSAHGRKWNSPLSAGAAAGGHHQQQQHQHYADGVGAHGDFGAGAPDDYSPTELSTFAKFHSGVSSTTRITVSVVLVLILVSSMSFIGGLVLAAGRPSRDFDVVSSSDVSVSDRELVFSVITRARNPGSFAKSIGTGELDVFATTTHTKHIDEDDSSYNKLSAMSDDIKRTVSLGYITQLESPMVFEGGFSSQTQWRTSSAKLVNPSANNTKSWSEISAHEFDLTIKGVLIYRTLGNEYRQSVSRAYHVVAPDFYDDIHGAQTRA